MQQSPPRQRPVDALLEGVQALGRFAFKVVHRNVHCHLHHLRCEPVCLTTQLHSTRRHTRRRQCAPASWLARQPSVVARAVPPGSVTGTPWPCANRHQSTLAQVPALAGTRKTVHGSCRRRKYRSVDQHHDKNSRGNHKNNTPIAHACGERRQRTDSSSISCCSNDSLKASADRNRCRMPSASAWERTQRPVRQSRREGIATGATTQNGERTIVSRSIARRAALTCSAWSCTFDSCDRQW